MDPRTPPPFGSDLVEVLSDECEKVSRVASELAPYDFEMPTRCPPWDVKTLLAHLYRDMDRLRTGLTGPEPEAPDASAVSYWRAYDPKVEGEAISNRAREAAEQFESGAELARGFEVNWLQGLALARGADAGRLLRAWKPALRLDHFLATRVLEVGVHGLDLAHALARPPWIGARATVITRQILIGLPASFGWDALTFIEAGTGRRPLTSYERSELGPLEKMFPLLS